MVSFRATTTIKTTRCLSRSIIPGYVGRKGTGLVGLIIWKSVEEKTSGFAEKNSVSIKHTETTTTSIFLACKKLRKGKLFCVTGMAFA